MRSQLELFEAARRSIAEANSHFLAMVTHPSNPLTREDLERLIARRPALWRRFESWLPKLPSREASP
jgi:hypothetical protein